MNEYVSVTVWKHSKPIDWADMQAMLTENYGRSRCAKRDNS